MRVVIIYAVLISAVSGYRSTGYAAHKQQQEQLLQLKDNTELLPLKEIAEITTLSDAAAAAASGVEENAADTSAKPSTTTLATSESSVLELSSSTSSTKPSTETIELISDLPITFPADNELETTKRRLINYDQRQEGQYNIRADLENFMIVLIPPSPAGGLNLLDLLTKSALRRNAAGGGGGKLHKKSYAGATKPSSSSSGRYHQGVKAAGINQNFNYLARQSASAESGRSGFQGPYSHPVTLEGRTPYQVDISSEEEQLRLHPDRQVDVLPPAPYPMAYQQFIKPFHLEVEALPPPELNTASTSHSPSTFLDSYNQLLASRYHDKSGSNANANINASPTADDTYYRVSRAIGGDSIYDTNGLLSTNTLNMYSQRRSLPLVPIYRADHSFGAGSLYPPIDAPRLAEYLTVNSNARTFDLDANDEHEENAHIGEIFVPPPNSDSPAVDDLELTLNSASLIDPEAKALLSDGLERCAPGRRRDSYGVCREIESY